MFGKGFGFWFGEFQKYIYQIIWYRLKYCLKEPFYLKQPNQGSKPQLKNLSDQIF